MENMQHAEEEILHDTDDVLDGLLSFEAERQCEFLCCNIILRLINEIGSYSFIWLCIVLWVDFCATICIANVERRIESQSRSITDTWESKKGLIFLFVVASELSDIMMESDLQPLCTSSPMHATGHPSSDASHSSFDQCLADYAMEGL
jgi:hypothetical protein